MSFVPSKVKPQVLTATEDDSLGLHSDVLQLLGQSPADQQAAHVGRNLDSSADLTNRRGGFKQGDLVPGLGEAVGSSETAETASDDNNVERVRGGAAFEEGGRLWGKEVGVSALRGMRG